LSRLEVVILDRPGNLALLTRRIAELGANILQIGQTRGFGEIAIGETEVELVVETTGLEHNRRLRQGLSREGFRVKAET
jgi:threonine dehydratase